MIEGQKHKLRFHQLALPLSAIVSSGRSGYMFVIKAACGHLNLHFQCGYGPRKLVAVSLQLFLESLDVKLLPNSRNKTLEVRLVCLKTGL